MIGGESLTLRFEESTSDCELRKVLLRGWEWTAERVYADLSQWAQRIYGCPPTAVDLDKARCECTKTWGKVDTRNTVSVSHHKAPLLVAIQLAIIRPRIRHSVDNRNRTLRFPLIVASPLLPNEQPLIPARKARHWDSASHSQPGISSQTTLLPCSH